MKSNLEKALTEIPEHNPRNESEQKAIWRQKLAEDLELEKEIAECLESNMELELESLFIDRHFVKPRKPAVQRRASTIDLLFTLMHRVAYFDGLLRGTGISKHVSRKTCCYEDD